MSSEFYTIPEELLVKHLLEETTPEEKLRVEKWLAQKEENRRHFAGLKLLLEKSGQVKLPYVDEEAAWQRFRQRIRQPVVTRDISLPAVKSRVSYLWMKVAAVFLVVLGLSFALAGLLQDQPARMIAVQSSGQVVADTLPDGSVVTLNKNSQVSYPEEFEGKTREVALSGEAFFSVKPDRRKPFLIKVNEVTVRVVGTSFNVKSFHGKTEVIVETGIVQVSKGSETIELKPGESVTVASSDGTLKKDIVEDKLYNYYQSRQFVCDHTPLWKLVEVVNQAYGVQIEFGRKEIRDLQLTVTFDNESLDKILQVISETLDVKIERADGRIILR